MLKFRPRYSLRTLLILVTLVPFGCWLYLMFDRHREFSARSVRYTSLYYVYQYWDGNDYWSLAEQQRNWPKFHEAEAYYRLLAEKYRRAASCPWLPVEADPPKSENVQQAEDLTQVFR